MKILVVFLDMVRVDQLNLFNPSNKVTHLDDNLTKIGGKLFTHCYTPGPDTPRSNACMQTGLYPYFNGCDTRIKWPQYFIKENVSTIYDHAADKGYVINACVRKHTEETGLMKYQQTTNVNVFHEYEDFVREGDFCNDSLSLVYDPDWHIAITDYKATKYAFKKGDEVVNILFEKFITKEFINNFDYTLIYSDHGFQFLSEGYKMKSKLELLNDGRNQILVFLHKKGDNGVVKDNRLASMLDVYATLEHLIGCNDYRQGYSLMMEPQRNILHIEDHQDFKVYPEVMIKQWRVISQNYDIRTDVYSTIVTKGENIDIGIIDSYLREYSPKYADYVKQIDIWKHYAVLSQENSDRYVVGVAREKKCLLYAIKGWCKIKSTIRKIL